MVFHDWGLLDFEEPFPKFRDHGLLIKEGAKMSKSKGNIVNPDFYIKEFGADTLRMYLMFLAPFEQGGDFRDASILGISRFLERVWKLGNSEFKKFSSEQLLHKTIKKITEDIENLHYNTAISALMILLNAFESDGVSQKQFETFLKLLAPFAPHVTEEMWHGLGNKTSVHKEGWPQHDKKLIQDETILFIVQINGKHRATIGAVAGLPQEEAETLVRQDEKVGKLLANREIKKIIFVPDRLINFVLE